MAVATMKAGAACAARRSSPRRSAPRRVRAACAATAKAEGSAAEDESELACFGVFCHTLSAEEAVPKTWKKTIRVAVSGAAGQISNHLLFMLASGEVFGADQPIALQLLGSVRSAEALEGVAMELEDSLYPLLREVQVGIDPEQVFEDADWALLIGAKPRGPGMERSDLLDMNGQIFVGQGQALNKVASRDVKVLVVGNPCNTNALIASKNAPDLDPRNFHALTRLDENRAKCQMAIQSGYFYDSISNVTIWGNHSTTQVPDFVNAKIAKKPAINIIGRTWLEEDFTPKIQTRGGALIKKWGRSSAASTAVSIADHIRSLVTPTPEGDWFSTAVITDGNEYGIPEGLVYSMPARSKGDGSYELVPASELKLDDPWLKEKMAASADELSKERDCVSHLIPDSPPAACGINKEEDTWIEGEK
eukprot:PRCOL_00004283-RA